MSGNHRIVIVRPLDPDAEVVVQARKIREFSRRLHRAVEEDRRHQREITRIEPTKLISTPALLATVNNLGDSSSQTNSSSSGTGDSAISIGQVDPYFSNRGGVYADISWRQILKPKPKQSPVEVWNSVAVDSWRRSTADILKKVDDFRKTGFRIMKVKDFESVRGSHLIIIHEDIIAAA
jgi:hypothetical protein